MAARRYGWHGDVPDVVLMDIRMPGLDGIRATEQITGDPDLGQVRVLVLTTFGEDEYIFGALVLGPAAPPRGHEAGVAAGGDPHGRRGRGPAGASGDTPADRGGRVPPEPDRVLPRHWPL